MHFAEEHVVGRDQPIREHGPPEFAAPERTRRNGCQRPSIGGVLLRRIRKSSCSRTINAVARDYQADRNECDME